MCWARLGLLHHCAGCSLAGLGQLCVAVGLGRLPSYTTAHPFLPV